MSIGPSPSCTSDLMTSWSRAIRRTDYPKRTKTVIKNLFSRFSKDPKYFKMHSQNCHDSRKNLLSISTGSSSNLRARKVTQMCISMSSVTHSSLERMCEVMLAPRSASRIEMCWMTGWGIINSIHRLQTAILPDQKLCRSELIRRWRRLLISDRIFHKRWNKAIN